MKEHSRSFFSPSCRKHLKTCDNCILFPVGNLNFELMKHSTYGGRGSGRVGSDFLSTIAGRVGSGQRFAGSGRVGSGRVQEKLPVDNSVKNT